MTTAAAILARLSFFPRRGRLFRAAAVIALFAVVAALDIAMGPDVSFLVFYVLPVLLASWFLGRREGLLVAVASVAVWTLDDVLVHRVYAHLAVPIWNHTGELVFFVFLAWMAGALKDALEREVRERTEHLEKDLALAREAQASLLPPGRLETGGFSVSAECRQFYGVGGDSFDLQDLGEDRLFVAVADVSGKGMAAALLMSRFLAVLRFLLPGRSGRLDELADELSESLRLSLGTPHFVTAFLGIVEDGWLRYANAGHCPGFVLRPGPPPGGVVSLDSTGTVLGLLPGVRIREKRVPFPPGALLVLYTDGLSECANAALEEFGYDRVAAVAARAARGASPASVVEMLLAAAEAHADGEPFGDDITVLCVRRHGAPEAGS